MMARFGKALAVAAMLGTSGMAMAAPPAPAQEATDALDLLKASIAFKTVEGNHQVPAYADYLKGVLVKGGFPAADIVFTPIGETGTLELTWRGSDPSLKPIVISDHMDVVAADPKDWTRDPFTAVVENGYIFGRGSIDDKFDVSMVITALIHLRQEGFKPKRTIHLALSGDEETEMKTAQALAPKLKGAELVLNGDGGGGVLTEDGKPLVYGLQAGEKTYADFEIAFTSPGGHSSRPGPVGENAIYRLAKAIDRIAAYQFPPQFNELTIAYLKATAERTPGPLGEAMKRFAANPKDAQAAATLSADPEYVGQVRTTCVATMLSGGHALNALPQKAAVSVNCRIFPGVRIPDVEATLKQVVADPGATFTVLGEPTSSDASPLSPMIMDAMKKAVAVNQPGVPIVPSMSAGASDSLYFRAVGIPSYGISGAFMKPSDDFAHGLNERAPVAAIPGALRQWHSLLTTLASE
jgi:carboxypeptidase PM20D1